MPARRGQGSRLIAALGVALAAFLALAPPLAWFGVNYGATAAAIQTKADIKAEIITQLAVANPDLWRYSEHRLWDLLSRQPLDLAADRARILDADGAVLVESPEPLPAPIITRWAGLYDYGSLVGRVEISRSCRDLLVETALVAAFTVLLAVALLLGLRALGARAAAAVAALDRERERAQVTLHSIGDAVITTGADETIEYLNPVAEALTGWPVAEAHGRPLPEVLRLIDEQTLEPIAHPLRHALRSNRARGFEGHVALLRRDGTSLAIEERAAPIRGADGTVVGAVIVFGDVSAARSMAQRISWAATHDALTGLVNRREFEARVEAALASARNSAKTHVLCYLDLDQFKVVNDTCGHGAGDALLRQLAALMQARVREADTLARLGGDEFGLLLDSCPLERAQRIAGELLGAIRDMRFSWEDKVFTVGASIGLAAMSPETESTTELFSAADTACYCAKEQGRNRVCVYQGGEDDLVQRRREMDWASRLTRALEENRFVLYHQPYLPLAAGAPGARHVEILLRLVDEDGNLVLPGAFIPAAERYNIMPAIDRWVVGEVCRRYRDLEQSLGTPLLCAVNLSGTSLNGEGLPEHIREQAALHRVPPAGLCFEITETAAINNLGQAARFMKELRELGFRFALDDFGTGSSSFGYLRSLPVDYLKIDGSFVRDMARDPMDRAMADTINRIGHIMGLTTVGEFAETEGAIQELRALGVDYAQGYGHREPEPLPEPAPQTAPTGA